MSTSHLSNFFSYLSLFNPRGLLSSWNAIGRLPGTLEATPSSKSSQVEEPTIESIAKDLLIRLKYQERPRTYSSKLKEALLEKIKSCGIQYDVNDPRMVKITSLAIAISQLQYPLNSLELQVHIAVYTWLSAVMDDLTSRHSAAISEFSRRFHEGLRQESTLMESYAENLRGMYKFYDPIIASTIIQSSLTFVDACLLENRLDFQTMPQTAGGERWAHYFRVKNGITDAYAFIAFPKDLFPDASSYLQIIPDVGDFNILSNDVLSFYKEELAGETENYVHIRANYENKAPLHVLQDIADETVDAWARVSKVVAGKGMVEEVWNELVQGYCALHLSLARYQLDKIGLGETIPFA